MSKNFREAMRRKSSGEGGFTLIELLVVVLILGILSGIVIVAVSNARTQAVNKACVANQVVLMKALDSYYADPVNAGYPAKAGSNWTPKELQDSLVPTYLHNLPPMWDGSASYLPANTKGSNPDYYLKATMSGTPSRVVISAVFRTTAADGVSYSDTDTGTRCPNLGN